MKDAGGATGESLACDQSQAIDCDGQCLAQQQHNGIVRSNLRVQCSDSIQSKGSVDPWMSLYNSNMTQCRDSYRHKTSRRIDATLAASLRHTFAPSRRI